MSKTVPVPERFHSRHDAVSRTYLYRLAVVKKDYLPHFQDPQHGEARARRRNIKQWNKMRRARTALSVFDRDRMMEFK